MSKRTSDAPVPAGTRMARDDSERLYILVLNENTEWHTYEVAYANMPTDLRRAVRQRMSDPHGSIYFEGGDGFDHVNRDLMVAIGAVRPYAGDGDHRARLEALHNTVPRIDHGGWMGGTGDGCGPVAYRQCDLLILSAFQ